MAESTRADAYEALPRVIDADDDRWSVPQTAMFVTLASAGLWALIMFGIRSLIG